MPAADQRTAADADRFARAVAAIDAVNATDPVQVTVDGVSQPKELLHADAVEHWVRRLDPEASEAQLLAARAHHLRRWALPRADYPDGRSGYLRWRTEQKKRHAAEVREILRSCGYDDATIHRVGEIVAKRGLGTDAQVQTHEDALCLTFLEFQLDELTDQLGFDHMVEVARKTVAKMSAAGLAATSELTFSPRSSEILAAALA
jgi:hypothetical protein